MYEAAGKELSQTAIAYLRSRQADPLCSFGDFVAVSCEVDLSTRYCISLYWAVTTLTTIGFGDIVAVTHAEYIYTIFCMYVGICVGGRAICERQGHRRMASRGVPT